MLRRLLERVIGRRKPRLRKGVLTALALHQRGEARTDDPLLMDLTVRLQLRFRAREIHPWDRDLSSDRASRKLARQCLSDTEAVLERLFAGCPDVDVIELNVIEPNPDGMRRVIFGTVRRDEFAQWHPLSTDMRLRLVGLHYRLVDDELEFLPPARFAEETGAALTANEFGGNAAKPH